MEEWQEYFAKNAAPRGYDVACAQMEAFCQMHVGRRSIVLVTSGGTTVPLERNTVRYRLLLCIMDWYQYILYYMSVSKYKSDFVVQRCSHGPYHILGSYHMVATSSRLAITKKFQVTHLLILIANRFVEQTML